MVIQPNSSSESAAQLVARLFSRQKQSQNAPQSGVSAPANDPFGDLCLYETESASSTNAQGADQLMQSLRQQMFDNAATAQASQPSAPDKTGLRSAGIAARPRNIVISGTNYWNPGDDFVRDGVITILRRLFDGAPLNFLFYNFNADFFPQHKFSGISNFISEGDLESYGDSVDAIVLAGLSAGDEMKDLYQWILANGLEDRVILIGASYENDYVAHYIREEPEATIFKHARIVIGRTVKAPSFLREAGIPYTRINCPAILSVPKVKTPPPGKRIERIGFSIQLPHGEGAPNHTCAASHYDFSVAVLRNLSKKYQVEVIAHHKSEYFHFLKELRAEGISVIFSSFYQDLFEIYPRYDLVITTRLHASLFANGHGIPGIIINDTDRHTHTLEGFPHSVWVNSPEAFARELARMESADLAAIARAAHDFKQALMQRYLEALREPIHSLPPPGWMSGADVCCRKRARKDFDPLPLLRRVEFGKGVHLQEGVARWLSNASEIRLPAHQLQGPVNVTFTLSAGNLWCYGNRAFQALVCLEDKPVRQLLFDRSGQQHEVTLRLDPHEAAQTMTIASTGEFVPAHIDANSRDQRRLALKLTAMTMQPIDEKASAQAQPQLPLA